MIQRYQIVERAPTLSEYRDLCASVGWESVINFAAASASLRNSVYLVVAMHSDRAIGMGRIVGDGAIYFYIQDIAVRPEYQRQGVGRAIMDHLMAYLRRAAPEKAFVGLFAAPGVEAFYERYGFSQRPDLTGMFQVISGGT